MEPGVYSFGDVQKDPVTGQLGSTAQAMRNLVEVIQVADELGTTDSPVPDPAGTVSAPEGV